MLSAFVHKGMIYESADYHNAVFVGYDEHGIARHAHKRGTGSESTYKGNAESCDPRYSFQWTGTDNTLYLFEAPIEKLHIGMGLEGERSEDNSIELQVRIAEIDAEFRKMLDRVSTETVEAFDEETATRLMNEKSRLQQQLDNIADAEQRRENAKSRLDDIYTILDGIKNRPMEYDDQIVRQLLECIVVDSKEQVTVIFKGGLKSVQPLTE